MTSNIKVYDPKSDDTKVFNLWQEDYGKTWPLSIVKFRQIISFGDHFVFLENNQKIVGFAATQIVGDKASILTLLGNDKKLLDYTVDYLKTRRVKQIQLGDGGKSYFWPGIPVNLPHLIKFFEDNDWVFTEDSYDLVRNTADYKTPAFIFKSLEQNNIKIKLADGKIKQNILSFEEKHFPEWLGAYKRKIELKDLDDIFYAEDENKNIIGTVFIFSSQSYSAQEHQIWKLLLGDDMGGISCLGVRQDMRQKGIGLALAAYATEQLSARKVGNIYVGYTWLVDWYGKLGYKVWRKYKMGWKKI